MNKLKIIIDGRMYRESGIGRYIRNLISKLKIIDKENEYFILHLKNDYDNLEYGGNFHKVLANFRWYGVGEQLRLPKLLSEIKADLVHFPHFNAPLFYRGKYVVTVHDLIHQNFSMQRATTHGPIVYKLKKIGYKKVFKMALKRSVKILVPSDFVKDQLIKDWRVDDDKVEVTYEAVDEGIFKIVRALNKNKINKILEKFGIKAPYIFYVGNAHPHKNVEGLIKAFQDIRAKYPDLLLVLSGNDHYFWQRIKKEFQDKNIIYTDYVSDEELVGLYTNALAFVSPSLEEGFGIPLLEAMACGCPVVSSDAGSLPEVGGDAAVYFNSKSIGDMSEKISKILDDAGLRKSLRDKGLTRCAQFSWLTLAQKTLEVYEKCALQ
ncbi:MAG: glycosyl transferase, group 1 [uncultured bacterium]|uniref:Glycosyl transferase, group 1 n=1 Tax=Candidatus Daviesbacteria bacterium GW2011_GWC2_40_12 TaxID=1618431 RepID=A0A0G0TXK1_9BACT|nr:MAG: glycosyl transferase, group 1 [uncultured bacterium]KKR17340.1 MAG: glycosyl transferase, group 1 [Candidatus Daviesbacteria bacterium GW2011_GWA2_39_33]KKR24938.1 MAG: glycosyl transferase, group 1 [Candidatus Daviesbacteria bacterium GW2011_GWB1_39_5]KKR42717.1 MAG: glycosyl transferase, group 1 [Candidatus Daviesbacteria bacterium GW2011_GWC2_40_12]OGE21389.1 MAG: hypothetical protein A2778_04450 [Candidatus Daviesbacteria bacterium RIFCSPHIGHO2_01_FULL_40_24]OGE30094.1 MAG: hypothe